MPRPLPRRADRTAGSDRLTSASRALLFVCVLAVCVGCDHVTKLAATAWLGPTAAVVPLAADTVRFQLAHNPGAFLSLGAKLPAVLRALLFVGLVPLGILFAAGVALRTHSTRVLPLVAMGLVAGGGLSNWLDRLAHDGVVTDFLSVGIGPLRTGIFNVADLAVVAGILLLAIAPRLRERAPGTP